MSLPVIDVGPLIERFRRLHPSADSPLVPTAPLPHSDEAVQSTARELHNAVSEFGFFYAAGTNVAGSALQGDLEGVARRFFALPEADKMRIAMEHGRHAHRGYFRVGGELTSGRPDWKEGLYFGTELPAGNPQPMHGPNLFPDDTEPTMRPLVLQWLDECELVGHAIMTGLAMGLGLDEYYFAELFTERPFTPFRIFHYPADSEPERWGVGEHTDYGVLTLLATDEVPGLQVQAPGGGWLEAPPKPDCFVCNIGDMLEVWTGGRYRATPHRVKNASGRGRLSMPFFFDPSFDAVVKPMAGSGSGARSSSDEEILYGQYFLDKCNAVFPDIAKTLGGEAVD